MPLRLALAAVVSLLASQTLSQALEIRAYAAADHDRFVNFPDESTTTHNPTFLWATTDLTGIGWDSKFPVRQFAMVSPRHFVGANHYKPNTTNNQIVFVNASGSVRTRSIAATTNVPNPGGGGSDLFLGTLGNTLTATLEVKFLPYLNLPTEGDYINLPLVTFGTVFSSSNPRAGIGLLESIDNYNPMGILPSRCLRFRYNTAGGGGSTDDDAYAQGGDSGSPTVVLTGGQAALVGTHSFIDEDDPMGPKYYLDTYDVFVPHYVDELNALMDDLGYHMTPVNPGTAALVLSAPLPPVIRAGYPFTIPLTLTNNGPDDANNLNLVNTLPPGASLNSWAGTDWFLTSNTGGALTTRKAGQANGADTTVTLDLTVPAPGTWAHTVAYLADESTVATTNLSLEVLESYLSWSSTLADATPGGDDDGDGIGNLYEYGSGGEATVSSQFLPGTSIPLLPEIFQSAPGTTTLRHIRRTDATARGLTYFIDSSPTLDPPAFADASGGVAATRTVPVDADFEQVEYDFPTAGAPLYFQVRIVLDESP